MGVGRRFFDLARGNLNSLLERAAKSELEARTDDELLAELQRRRSSENAQLDERQRAAAMEAAARARGQKRETERARTEPPKKRTTRAPAEGLGRAHRLRALYAELGCRSGASFDEVKSAYRALMRKHHPDHHAGDPLAQKRASDRSAAITTAYAELEALLSRQ